MTLTNTILKERVSKGRDPKVPECHRTTRRSEGRAEKRADHVEVNHGSSGIVVLSFCRGTFAAVPSDLVNHVDDGPYKEPN